MRASFGFCGNPRKKHKILHPGQFCFQDDACILSGCDVLRHILLGLADDQTMLIRSIRSQQRAIAGMERGRPEMSFILDAPVAMRWALLDGSSQDRE